MTGHPVIIDIKCPCAEGGINLQTTTKHFIDHQGGQYTVQIEAVHVHLGDMKPRKRKLAVKKPVEATDERQKKHA